MSQHDGGAAFPIPGFEEGMSLRDYYAAKAMQGMLSRDSYQGGWCPTPEGEKKPCGVKRVAKFAYEYADAMIKARVEE